MMAVAMALAYGVTPSARPEDAPAKAGASRKSVKEIGREWTSLFDGRTLNGWKVTQFGGEGSVEVKDGVLWLGVGNDLTGVTIDRPIPRTNYEVTLEAKRVEGSDFFCGLTFPVKNDPCSLILGGWGGGVCGLSSIDGNDASENDTTKYRKFEKGRWYSVRLRVTDQQNRSVARQRADCRPGVGRAFHFHPDRGGGVEAFRPGVVRDACGPAEHPHPPPQMRESRTESFRCPGWFGNGFKRADDSRSAALTLRGSLWCNSGDAFSGADSQGRTANAPNLAVSRP